MRWSFVPVASRVLQRLKGYRELEEYAERVISISLPDVMPLEEAIYLPGQVERITGPHELATSLADELDQIFAPNLSNIEARAYLVRDAVIGHNRISTWSGYKDLSDRVAQSRPIRITEELESAALCSSCQGNDYFAHFLIDDAATHALAKNFGEPFFSGNGTPRTVHCFDYLSRFGIEYVEKQNILVRKLWLFRDFPMVSDKRRRLQAMIARSKAVLPKSPPSPGAFIRRGVTGQRRILENAEEIEAWCAQQGFVIVDPEHQSVNEICSTLNRVPLVIGVEGSHLVHALFNMAAGGTLICIQPADRFNVVFRYLCAALNLRWGFVVAEGTVEGFRLDLEDLKATLDLVVA